MANLLYNLAQPFSDTKQYTQGAIVIYNDRMYEMTADEYTPGPFEPEKFTERFLSEMISGKLNSNLSKKYTLTERYTGSNNLKSLFDLSSVYDNYKNITIDNMVIQLNNIKFDGSSTITWGYFYNAETGIITVDSNQKGLLCYPSSITVCIVG